MITDRKAKQWMDLCVMAADTFSTCDRRHYFAFILDEHGHALSTGYNGGPKGFLHCTDGGCPRSSTPRVPGAVYDNCIAIHAEQNALLHADYSNIQRGTLIVNGPPCFTCAKLIVNSGLSTVVYKPDHDYLDWPNVQTFLETAGITLMARWQA